MSINRFLPFGKGYSHQELVVKTVRTQIVRLNIWQGYICIALENARFCFIILFFFMWKFWIFSRKLIISQTCDLFLYFKELSSWDIWRAWWNWFKSEKLSQINLKTMNFTSKMWNLKHYWRKNRHHYSPAW